MKRKVVLSTYSVVITILAIGLLIGIMIYELRTGNEFLAYIAGGMLVLMSVMSLFFTPLSVSVEDGCLNMNASFRAKSIPLREIEEVRLTPPTMSEKRIFGSGGWFGYWGWFSEPSIGKYMAYYGKASDCFLVRLKNGKQYMLGCIDPLSMMESINQNIKKA